MNFIYQNVCKTMWIGLLAVATMVLPSQRLAAQSAPPEPAIVISIADINQQLSTIEYVLNASGFPQFKFIAQSAVKGYSKGVDTKRPAGAFLFFRDDRDTPDVLAYVPVSNLDDLLDTIAGLANLDEDGDTTVATFRNGMELNIKKVGDAAYIAMDSELLSRIPEDVHSILEDLPSRYNLAAKVVGSRIPKALRDQWIDTVRDGYERQLEMMGQDDSVQADLQEMNFSQMERALNEMESVLIGVKADKEGKRLYFDLDMVATAGTELAGRLNASRLEGESEFKGFLQEGAAMTAHVFSGFAPEDIEQFKSVVERFPQMIREELEDEDLTNEEIDTIEKAVSRLTGLLLDTAASGKIDAGAVLKIGEQELNFASGIALANPAELETAIKELLPLLEEKIGAEVQIEMNAGSYKDVTFHQIVVDIPDVDEKMTEVLGNRLVLVVGIGSKGAYFASGTNPMDLLKDSIDGPGPSEGANLPLQFNLHVGQILDFASRFETDRMVKHMASKLLETGGDRIRVTSESLENGYRGRFEIQDGLLGLIKVGFESLQGGGDFEDGEF